MSGDSGGYKDNSIGSSRRSAEKIEREMSDRDYETAEEGETIESNSRNKITSRRRKRESNDPLLFSHLAVMLDQVAFWAKEQERYAGYVEVLHEYHEAQLRGERPVLSDKLKEAIAAYQAAHPGYGFDVNNPQHTKYAMDWAAEMEAHAAENLKTVEQAYLNSGGSHSELASRESMGVLEIDDETDLFSGISAFRSIDPDSLTTHRLNTSFNSSANPTEVRPDNTATAPGAVPKPPVP